MTKKYRHEVQDLNSGKKRVYDTRTITEAVSLFFGYPVRVKHDWNGDISVTTGGWSETYSAIAEK